MGTVGSSRGPLSFLPPPNHLGAVPGSQRSLQPLPLPEAPLEPLPEPPQEQESAAGGGRG